MGQTLIRVILIGCSCSNLHLSQLINRQVFYQAAADLGITVSAEAVNEVV